MEFLRVSSKKTRDSHRFGAFLAILGTIASFIFLYASSALAQKADLTAKITGEVVKQFIGAFKWSTPGSIYMWFIVIAFGSAVAFIVERIIVLVVRSKVDTNKFMSEIIKLVKAKQFDRAMALCNQAPLGSVLPAVIKAGLSQVNNGVRAVQNSMDEASLTVIPKVQARLNYISVFANVSTLCGLMGTIYGLIYTFASLALVSEAEKATYLAQGIAAAMNTTLCGLLAAVPLLIVHTWLSNQASGIVDDLDEQSVKFINTVAEL